MRLLGSATVLALLWLLMSGIYKPLVVGLGALSVALVLFVTRRMDAIDGDRPRLAFRPLATLGYLTWLLVEIAKANWAVSRLILSRTMPIRQMILDVPGSQATDLGRTLFANSITLTPGTISVETVEGENVIQVHAVAYDEGDHEALAEMGRRVSAIEAQRAG
ncbi:MAG: Na+/H+ antiporter subunit E [Paracoccaceae bacterium]|nr:Na+/H+ antiporter subunit E [Paracoccaceae bacterium]